MAFLLEASGLSLVARISDFTRLESFTSKIIEMLAMQSDIQLSSPANCHAEDIDSPHVVALGCFGYIGSCCDA